MFTLIVSILVGLVGFISWANIRSKVLELKEYFNATIIKIDAKTAAMELEQKRLNNKILNNYHAAATAMNDYVSKLVAGFEYVDSCFDIGDTHEAVQFIFDLLEFTKGHLPVIDKQRLSKREEEIINLLNRIASRENPQLVGTIREFKAILTNLIYG